MQKIAFMMTVFATLLGFAAQAQLRGSSSSNLEGLKEVRRNMEMNTELSILEKLEESRMEDEKKRLQQYETLDFSVVGPKNFETN